MKNSKTWNLNLLLSLSFVWLSTPGSFAQPANKPIPIPSRNQFIQQIAPYIDGREEIKKVSRTSPDYYRWLTLLSLEKITDQWLQHAHYSKSIPADWIRFWYSGHMADSLDMLEEHIFYQQQLNPVLGFMYRDTTALLLTLIDGDTAVFLINRIKWNGAGHNMLNMHRLYKDDRKEPAYIDVMYEYEGSSSQKLPANITGAFFYPESASKQKNAIAAELKEGSLVVFKREWSIVHQSGIDAIVGPAYRIVAKDKQTQELGYFTIKVVGSPGVTWQLSLFQPAQKNYFVIGEKKMKDSYKYQRLAKKILYYLATIIGGGSAMVLVIFYFVQRRRKHQQLRTQMALSGLRAQLNPHFLFNTLTSIQDLVNQENKSAANRYFNEMAQLLRYVVDSSAEEYTSLAAELAALEKYCSLEALRTPFNYHFDIRPEIDLQNTEIPTMLLQPFVENAILHGLRPSSIPKDLHISIWPEGEYRIGISIIDNGIGIEAGEASHQRSILKRSHQGIKTTQKRIDLLNIGKKQKITLTIVDRSQLKPNQTGTLVQLSIPI
ncbi:sensor histidine kinase [Haliscomenobacter hydrossis]|uniref:Histidine kinase n=1 Tax=Haliscomenobacter hydrossis (strain ATCC 27775 / DSM 1100 / LMG 10767 / O) TaxID=760192 RepID=F4L760_HALH1|nr:histidine kinase [Haliscomenobacter hydrossis]AEE52136.1 histidine kinase [Haliscomenobacter hydrossis DSM 1100]